MTWTPTSGWCSFQDQAAKTGCGRSRWRKCWRRYFLSPREEMSLDPPLLLAVSRTPVVGVILKLIWQLLIFCTRNVWSPLFFFLLSEAFVLVVFYLGSNRFAPRVFLSALWTPKIKKQKQNKKPSTMSRKSTWRHLCFFSLLSNQMNYNHGGENTAGCFWISGVIRLYQPKLPRIEQETSDLEAN